MDDMSKMTQFSGVSDIFASNPYFSSSSEQIAAAAVSAFSRLMSQHKDLYKRYSFYISQLNMTFKEAETLRQENTNLRFANSELTHKIAVLLEAAAVSFSEKSLECPANVIENESNNQHKVEEVRVSLPKSISVRSNGYLKTSPGGTGASGSSGSSSEDNPKSKRGSSSKTRALKPVSGAQKVYVCGGSKKDDPIELEVFNQGMFKTELCNKWEETGDCPYDDHCQYAHGIKELRAVIRHPRYKTEVCRLILAGDSCPYGHRCHFRHALTQEEQQQLMLPLRLE